MELKTLSVKTHADAQALYDELMTRRQVNRQRELSLASREQIMNKMPVLSSGDMGMKLQQILPPHLKPLNVGHIDNVMWDFFFPVTFDLGNNPLLSPTFRMRETFNVNIEASFLLCGMIIDCSLDDINGLEAPLTMTVRNASSTRQFNDNPFPIQNLGQAGLPFIFETPLLLSGNSTVETELSTWLQENLQLAGNPKFDITFFGLRVRDENGANVVSTLFL